jgi:fructose-1,6-bisphosphatase/sedoheptulose 1,7-bisphosphatase-like protein
MSNIIEAARQQASICHDDQAQWCPSDEPCSISHDTHHLCLMAKKSKKKAIKKEQVKEKAQVDDQGESDVEIEDSYTLDHLSSKDKLIFMKLVQKNDELEEENEKQEQSLQKQEMFLISKLEELKATNKRYEKLSIEHVLVTSSASSVGQL